MAAGREPTLPKDLRPIALIVVLGTIMTVAAARADAFGHAHGWALAGILVTAIPALMPAREEDRARRRAAATAADPEAAAAAVA